MPYDAHNPLTVSLPYNFVNVQDYPTEVMANRFSAWRAIIKELLNYFKEYATAQEESIKQQARLQQALGVTARQLLSLPSNNNSSNNNPGSPNIGAGILHHHGNNSSNGNSNNGNIQNIGGSGGMSQEVDLISKFFLPVGNGSVQDVPNVLFKYHQQNVTFAQKTLKDINAVIIPKLEELRKDLLLKIKEIKNLQNDFKNNLARELSETKSLIGQYNQAIDMASKLDPDHKFHNEGEHGKYDPYLVKIRLDRQVKKQLQEENYLYDAYSNLQNAGKQLEGIVVAEIQNYISMFVNLLKDENSTFNNYLFPNLTEGFLAKEYNFEWNAFIERNLPSNNLSVSAVGNQTTSSVKNGTFIDLDIPKRHFHDLIIKNIDSNLNAAVREGFLERRSKFLKNYSSAWYVLTCSFIHEFKSNDRKKDPHPVMSLPLDSCAVSDHSKNDGKVDGVYKFILTSKSANALMHKTHKWVFRTNTYQNMIDWFDDIKKLTSLPTPSARARILPNRSREDVNSAALAQTLSGNSSIRSPTRSLRTIDSNNSAARLHRSGTKNTSVTRPISQGTSIANARRLSSTFSQKQSPRLANMVNSDGTLITPVDTYADVKRNKSQLSHTGYVPEENDHHQSELSQQQQQQQQPQTQLQQPQPQPQSSQQQLQPQQSLQEQEQQYRQARSQSPVHYQPYHLIPVDSFNNSSNLRPESHAEQFSQHQPSNSISAPNGMPYYIPPSSQPQQFYDPVQHQYYTITPSVPSQSISRTQSMQHSTQHPYGQQSQQQQQQQQQQVGTPQPQFFPSSPQQANVALSTSPMMQPFGSAFFQNYQQPGQQQQQQQQQQPQPQPQSQQLFQQQKSDVPYPMSPDGTVNGKAENGEAEGNVNHVVVNNQEHSNGNGDHDNIRAPLNAARQLSADEVSTLKSSNIAAPHQQHSEHSEHADHGLPNGNGDINIVITKDE
ncbi:phosphatidylinositol 4,5-bisphosphate-binding protein [Lodderomyces elongisporus]|uniref:phosphatidylinositol 4,5-bisphosphate-binding protein n=1 Tax=Lodderomyces elongisporus TaxID=36914 RepID=UPI00291FD937|nr:phosphatidylinositol 4,5-bisphosphate-binding protein [Lodderomyces elongisporus]WLF81742.1 phosphatidylinositol 4,5-bisphosphate-binding protein [Lodderomyces elongisporus]